MKTYNISIYSIYNSVMMILGFKALNW